MYSWFYLHVSTAKVLLVRFSCFFFHFSRPSVLDSFLALSGQTSTLMRQLTGEKFPPIHNRVILPLQVSSDRDIDLEVRVNAVCWNF